MLQLPGGCTTRVSSVSAFFRKPAPFIQPATTVAVSTGRAHLATDRIERFRRDLIGFRESDASDRDEVYHLEIALFPLTPLRTKGVTVQWVDP
jgi:hypothetical protein